MKRCLCYLIWSVSGLSLAGGQVLAHDPVFSPGPHVLYKEGIDIHLGTAREKAGEARNAGVELALTYGLTGNWAAGVELPYRRVEAGERSATGPGDALLFTKFRFWRDDRLGVQESAAVLLNVMLDNGDETTVPAVGSGSTDTLLGLTYGYESRRWYRWASFRYRRNGVSEAGLRRGDKLFVDLVVGLRPKPPVYLQPDTVWILELNGENSRRSRVNGVPQDATGGTQWFVSPGIFWTLRNFAIKAGVQVPVVDNMKGDRGGADYRGVLEFEWHL